MPSSVGIAPTLSRSLAVDRTSQANVAAHESLQRHRIAMVAFCCDPEGTMEQRNGWQRAVAAASKYEVHLFFCPRLIASNHSVWAASHEVEHLHVHAVDPGRLGRKLLEIEACFYIGYAWWHRLVYHRVRELHRSLPFDLCHLVTLCGFRQSGWLHELPIPLIWGPIGGTHNFPRAFLKELSLGGQIRERLRSWINSRQLTGHRFQRTLSHAKVTIAATAAAAAEIYHATGRRLPIDLETGLDYAIDSPRELRPHSHPLRILWAGRLRDWKALPLLLSALQKLPSNIEYELVVLGDGGCRQRWQQLATQLCLRTQIRWVAWPTYRKTIEYYRWADIFAFTSLRDTSGTGLLEALAAGCVIVGLNHQGAASVMNESCAKAISVDNPEKTIAELTSAIAALHDDRRLLRQLSDNAIKQAARHTWQSKRTAMLAIYDRVLSPQPSR